MIARIRWGLVAAAIALLAVMPWFPPGGAALAQEKQRIAMLDLAEKGAEQEAEAIAEELRKILVKSKKYVVVDRTLTAQILKEWETQQSGLTAGEKAVKIGKLFNVQLIVSGKLNKFPSGGWQVSVVMLDAQSGVAIEAETVRHRGEFFSLLDGKVPALGAALVGVAAPPVSAGQPASAALPAPAAASGGIKKLAIYPALYSGPWGRNVEFHHVRIMSNVRSFLRKKFPGEFKIAREYASLGDIGGEKNGYISGGAWKGFFTREPDENFIYNSAKKIGADLVLIYETTVPGGGAGGKHHVYLFDAGLMRSIKKSTHWKDGQLTPTLKRIIGDLLEEYKRKR